jgi:hypothetical protein
VTNTTPTRVEHEVSPGAHPRELTHIEQRDHPDWATQTVIPTAPPTATPTEDAPQ